MDELLLGKYVGFVHPSQNAIDGVQYQIRFDRFVKQTKKKTCSGNALIGCYVVRWV